MQLRSERDGVAVHQPRLAEIVVTQLRDRIVSGQLQPGSELPRQELLMKEFGVGKPAMREALRVLEIEGLITIKRGNQGGATVHAPHARNAAHAIGLVLQSWNVSARDLRDAIIGIEPLCVAMCAAREDRHEAVLPILRAAQTRMIEVVEDEYLFTEASREFHELVVKHCGNSTLVVVAGSLETLWSGQQLAWSQDATAKGKFPKLEEKLLGIQAHERLLQYIDDGNVEAAQAQAKKHLTQSLLHALDENADRVIFPIGTRA